MPNVVSYCFAYKKAVDSGFLNYVTSIIHDRQHMFQANQYGAARKFLKIENVLPGGDEILFGVKKRLAEHYGVGDYVVPPKLEDFIGYITEGGFIHAHKDPDLLGRMHVRVNVLICQPAGCIPLIEGIPISVAVGDAWLNLASRCVHATTAVEGPGHRSALSFGYEINPSRGEELYDLYKVWRSGIRQLV